MDRVTKKYLLKLRMYLIPDARKRTKLLIKKDVFKSVGDNFFFQPRVIPDEAKLIKFGNNVVVASNVTFVTHDIIDKVFNNLKEDFYYNYNAGPILIGDNVFIGCNSIILPNIKIGSNSIIAAGSVVTHDVEEGTVVAGNPARVIGKFEDYKKRRQQINDKLIYPASSDALNKIWEEFENEKNSK